MNIYPIDLKTLRKGTFKVDQIKYRIEKPVTYEYASISDCDVVEYK